MPNAPVPAAATGLPSSSRRRLLLGAAAASTLLATPTAASISHPDAAILAYAPRLAALQEEIDRRGVVLSQTGMGCDALAGPRPDHQDPTYAAWSKRWRWAKRESGYDAAQDHFDAAVRDIDVVLDVIAEISAKTLDGLCIKARYGQEYAHLIDSILADLVAIDRRAQA